MNVLEYLIEQETITEKEIYEARDKIRNTMDSASKRTRSFADAPPEESEALSDGLYEYVQAETVTSDDELAPFPGLMAPVNAGEF